MRFRVVLALLVAGDVALSATASTAHEAPRVNAQQRVFSKRQSLDRSVAEVQIRVTNRRFSEIRRLVCETVISDGWTHATTGEVRNYNEDWFLVIRNVPPRTRLRSRRDVILVSHPELATDPAWQPEGVTIKTRHCHAKARARQTPARARA